MTALVLKTLSDLGCGSSRWNEELHFSVDETFFEKENNPCVSSLSQKFSFSVLLSSDGGKIFFSITCRRQRRRRLSSTIDVDDGRMNGLSMLATMFSRLDVPNCDLVFLRLKFFISSMMRTKSTRALSFSFYQHFCRAE